MSLQRIKGQEVELRFILNGRIVSTITEIKSFEVALQFEILREGMLGETTERRDDIFKGVKGKAEIQLGSGAIFDLARQLLQRSTRREPGITINAKAAFNFPQSARRIALIDNLFFGELPFSVSSRSDYVTSSLEFEAENMRFI